MDAVARLGAIGCAHANRDELRFEWTFRTVAPGDATPGPFTAAGDDVFGGAARVRRQRVNPSWTKRRRSGHVAEHPGARKTEEPDREGRPGLSDGCEGVRYRSWLSCLGVSRRARWPRA